MFDLHDHYDPCSPFFNVRLTRYVKSVFVHVGGTRCVTSSTGHTLKIQACITLTVEVIRTCLVIFVFDVYMQ